MSDSSYREGHRRNRRWHAGYRGGSDNKHWRHRHQNFKSNRSSGWNLNLYRNKQSGKIAGVCAGIADHLDIAPWVARLIFIGAFFWLGGLMIMLYIAFWLLLSPKPEGAVDVVEYDEDFHGYRKKKLFRYPESPSGRLKKAKQRFKTVTGRVEAMETYVTSRQYELNKAFSEIK